MPYSGELARDKQEVAVAVAEEERVRGRGWDQHDQRGQHDQTGTNLPSLANLDQNLGQT